MSGLIFQMRNMAADAVISLDGWEGKKLGSDRIQGSIYFDIIKMRVPYLCFQQDNPPMQDLQANSEIVDLLKYSERYFYVLKNLEHPDYTLNKIAFSKNNIELIQSYKFMYSTVLNFLNKYTKGNGEKINLNHDEEILKMSLSANALPSVPTQLEFENIIMNEKDISKAFKVFRDSKKIILK